MNSKISEKDKKTWDEFLSNDQKLPDKDNSQAEIHVKKSSPPNDKRSAATANVKINKKKKLITDSYVESSIFFSLNLLVRTA